MTSYRMATNRVDSGIKKQANKGVVILNTGGGKGKTTAALGVLFRAWGHNMKVVMLQFIKGSAECGEQRAARRLGIEILAGGAGFVRRGKNQEKGRLLSLELWKLAQEKIDSGAYHIVILDEFTYPLSYGWIPVTEVLDVLEHRPEHVHVVITGRSAPQELIDFADIVTDMREIKHPLKKGVRAQPGIEF
ncbi:cob(I)yrinic acid a,c-diamide adenosyltransferase [Chloroflexota bacterium]